MSAPMTALLALWAAILVAPAAAFSAASRPSEILESSRAGATVTSSSSGNSAAARAATAAAGAVQPRIRRAEARLTGGGGGSITASPGFALGVGALAVLGWRSACRQSTALAAIGKKKKKGPEKVGRQRFGQDSV